MQESFDIMGFTQTEKEEVYKMCAGIMHSGSATFKQRPREEQAEADDVKGAPASTCRHQRPHAQA